MMSKYSGIMVNTSDSILMVLKRMDEVKHKLLLVLEDGKFKSVISIGDIQRAIINNIDLNTPISVILRADVTYASDKDDINKVKERMILRRNELMPIINEKKDIVDIIFWEEISDTSVIRDSEKFDLPIIIMAGGKGSRLKPLTNVLPKPLIPINNKTIIEEIMDRFINCGSNRFYISLNYKAELIRYYLDHLNCTNYNIFYFLEQKPLGTAGSLHLLKDKITSTFFVSNCDIIVDQDLSEILKYHKENKNEITVVAAMKHYPVPYGTLLTQQNGLLSAIEEKPEFVYKINTGLYILESHLIDEIPENQLYHITSLIIKLQNENRRVGVFPISQNAWTDIGNWEEYFTYIRKNASIHGVSF